MTCSKTSHNFQSSPFDLNPGEGSGSTLNHIWEQNPNIGVSGIYHKQVLTGIGETREGKIGTANPDIPYSLVICPGSVM